MKHTWKVTLILIMMFLGAQIIGLVIVDQYVDTVEIKETGID